MRDTCFYEFKKIAVYTVDIDSGDSEHIYNCKYHLRIELGICIASLGTFVLIGIYLCI